MVFNLNISSIIFKF